MSWNNYNISIPAEIVPVGELVRLTTGSTWTGPGGIDATPGPIYADYVCTELLPQFRYAQLLTTHLDGYGNPIRLYAPPQREAMGILLVMTFKHGETRQLQIFGWQNAFVLIHVLFQVENQCQGKQ